VESCGTRTIVLHVPNADSIPSRSLTSSCCYRLLVRSADVRLVHHLSAVTGRHLDPSFFVRISWCCPIGAGSSHVNFRHVNLTVNSVLPISYDIVPIECFTASFSVDVRSCCWSSVVGTCLHSLDPGSHWAMYLTLYRIVLPQWRRHQVGSTVAVSASIREKINDSNFLCSRRFSLSFASFYSLPT